MENLLIGVRRRPFPGEDEVLSSKGAERAPQSRLGGLDDFMFTEKPVRFERVLGLADTSHQGAVRP